MTTSDKVRRAIDVQLNAATFAMIPPTTEGDNFRRTVIRTCSDFRMAASILDGLSLIEIGASRVAAR